MSKIKLLFFVFLCLSATIVCARADGNAECSQQEQEKIKNNSTAKSTAVLQNIRSTLDTYNSFAKKYEESCNRGLSKKTPVIFSDGARQSIIMVAKSSSGGLDSAYFVRGDNFQYTGIAWNAESPKSSECKNLQKQAADSLNRFNSLRVQAENVLAFVRKDETANIACVCDNSGQNSECVSYADKEHEANAQIEGCKPFSSYLSEFASCPLCPIFQVVLTADASLASIAWKALASALQPIVLTFFLVYLALQTLKTIAAPSGAGTGAYLKSVIGLGLKVAITYFILNSSADVYNYIISPIVKGGLDMGIAYLAIGNPGAKDCMNKASMFSMASGGEMDASLMGSIYNAADCFSQSASTMPAVGRALICYGWEKDTIPDFGVWADGLVVYIFGLGIWMVIGFYLIDCTVQLGILCAFVPVLIACWPFKLTTRYTNKGMSMLMNTFFNFALAGIMLVVGMEIIGYSASSKDGDISTLMNAINENDRKKIEEIASLDGMQVLILLACCIFAFKLIGIINDTAQKFASGAGSNIAAKMGGTAASAATVIGKGGLKMVGKVAGTAGKQIADKTGLTAVANKVANTAAQIPLSAASMAGKAVGLGRFQNQGNQGMPTQQYSGNSGGGNNGGGNNGGGNNGGGNNGGGNNGGGNNGGGNNGASSNNGSQPTP